MDLGIHELVTGGSTAAIAYGAYWGRKMSTKVPTGKGAKRAGKKADKATKKAGKVGKANALLEQRLTAMERAYTGVHDRISKHEEESKDRDDRLQHKLDEICIVLNDIRVQLGVKP